MQFSGLSAAVCSHGKNNRAAPFSMRKCAAMMIQLQKAALIKNQTYHHARRYWKMNTEAISDSRFGNKICLLNDSFPPLIDGVATTVLNYAAILPHFGKQAVVATPDYPGIKDQYPFPVVRYPSFNTTKLVGYRAGYPFDPRSLTLLQKENCCLIHSHCPFVSTYLARSLREIMEIPIVFTYHTKFDIDISKAVKSKVLRESSIKVLVDNIDACDEVWTVSRGAADNLRQLGYSGEIVQMENGVDFQKGKAPDALCAAIRKEYALPPDCFVLLYVGRMMWYKGIHIILDGLKKATDRQLDFRMVFVGGGTDFEEIRKEVTKLGLSEYCVFTGPVNDRPKIAGLFSMADLFLFPSTYDTNGIVVREAAACGLPSVLIRGSCAAEDITDGRNGILIDEDADALATAVVSAYAHRDALRMIGEHAMDEIYLSWEDSIKAAVGRYDIVLNDYRRGKYERKPKFTDGMFLKVAEAQELLTWFQSKISPDPGSNNSSQ